MSMVHLTKGQIIMVNWLRVKLGWLIWLNLIHSIWLIWLSHGHFDGHLSILTRSCIHIWSKKSFYSNVIIKCNMCFSCPKPLVKMDIPLGQCGHFGQIGILKSHIFLYCIFSFKIQIPTSIITLHCIAILKLDSKLQY
jgi:hypothetical protein